MFLDRPQQLVDGCLDADADTGLDAVACAAQESREWFAGVLGERPREGHLDGRFCHVVTPHRGEQGFEGGDIGHLPPEDGGNQVALEQLPGGFHRFVRIPGPFAGDTLAPMRATLDLEPNQQGIPILLHAEACPKWFEEPHLEHAELDRIDFHRPGRAWSGAIT